MKFVLWMSRDVDKTGREYVRDKMPMMGLGLYQVPRSVVETVVDAALDAGYRFFDTAQVYRNEAALGDALHKLLPKYGLAREDVFITTKLSPSNQGSGKAAKSMEKSLAELRTAYIDLVLIHWPGSNKIQPGDERNRERRRESWREMEGLYGEGKIRSIGVSNYEVRHMNELLEECAVHPAVNQCELHPHFQPRDVIECCEGNDVHFQAYSSLGGPDHVTALLEDERVKGLADKYSCSPILALLAWPVALGHSTLPRSCKPDNVKSNYAALSVNMCVADARSLVDSEQRDKQCWDPDTVV